MSSKSTRKNAVTSKNSQSPSNAIITRTKSAQQTRQLRAKTKKNEKPVITKQASPKLEIKSTKNNKSENGCKDTPLKKKVMHLVKLVEQVEYYPEKLKRNLTVKKVFLQPKPNFKVVATTNKRKLGVPQKGGQKSSPVSRERCSSKASSEMSMADMVRLIEDNHTLSDEDFMEILTCPSPVWWEDPPDDRYTEDAICKRSVPAQSSPIVTIPDENKPSLDNTEEINQTNIFTNKTNTQTNDIDKTNLQLNANENVLIDFENEIEEFKITTRESEHERISIKKRKLENILGNIKNKKNNDTNINEINEVKKNDEIIAKPRRASISTDGEDFSDISFNEEEILKNLENIQIPVEENSSKEEKHITNKEKQNTNIAKQVEEKPDNKIEINIIGTEMKKMPLKKRMIHLPVKNLPEMPKITVKNLVKKTIGNDMAVPGKMPPLTRKPEITGRQANFVMNSGYLSNVSHTKFNYVNNDDCAEAKNVNTLDKSSSCKQIDTASYIKEEYEIKGELFDAANTTGNSDKNVFFRKKVMNDLSEYITVYKIMAHENGKNGIDSEKINKIAESSNNNVSGRLNNFFKKRKSNKRMKKCDSAIPDILFTDVKETSTESVKDSENDENRLKPCDQCVVKTENGATFSCDSCNLNAATKNVCKNDISFCKDVARIPWNQNYLTNQT